MASTPPASTLAFGHSTVRSVREMTK